MYTFNKMWGVVTPEEAAAKIEEQRKEVKGELNILVDRNRKSGNLEIGVPILGNRLFCA